MTDLEVVKTEKEASMTNKEYADSLRMIADFFEKHEEVRLPANAHEFAYYAAPDREDMKILAKALGGRVEKVTAGDFFELHRRFGSITFKSIAKRDKVCRRVVVGTKEVSKKIIPEMIIPAHNAEIVEWHCDDPILVTHGKND